MRKDLGSGTLTVELAADRTRFFEAQTPKVSSDGRKIAVLAQEARDPWGTQLHVLDRSTGGLTLVSRDQNGVSSEGSGNAAWAPTGDRIAFVTHSALVPADTNGTADIYIADLDRGTLLPLAPKTPDGRNVEEISASSLAWSPRGDTLMYSGSGPLNDLVQFLP